MWYSKKEEYVFTCPKEYKAYLKFKDDLTAAGIRFTESGTTLRPTIELRITGNFYQDENGVMQMNKEVTNGN